MVLTKIYNQLNFDEVEIYITEPDDYFKNNLKIDFDLMLIFLYQSQIELNGDDLEKENQEKNKLRKIFLNFTNCLKTRKINIIDPATGYSLNHSLDKLIGRLKYLLWSLFKLPSCEPINIPRVTARLENNCYQYHGDCQGKHNKWGAAVYPCLILFPQPIQRK
jgi:hypothetical protein